MQSLFWATLWHGKDNIGDSSKLAGKLTVDYQLEGFRFWQNDENHPCGENIDFWRNLTKSSIELQNSCFFIIMP